MLPVLHLSRGNGKSPYHLVRETSPSQLVPHLRTAHTALGRDAGLLVVQMPSYCLYDCHYFYRTALRLLSIPTCLAALYA
jgi:hypothetical protein